MPDGERVSVGQLRFPRDENGTATIDTGPGNFQGGFVEVYKDAETPADVPRWHVSLGAPTADGHVSATGTSTSYSSAADGVTNADAHWLPSERAVDIQVGGAVVQEHTARHHRIEPPRRSFLEEIVAKANGVLASVRAALIAPRDRPAGTPPSTPPAKPPSKTPGLAGALGRVK